MKKIIRAMIVVAAITAMPSATFAQQTLGDVARAEREKQEHARLTVDVRPMSALTPSELAPLYVLRMDGRAQLLQELWVNGDPVLRGNYAGFNVPIAVNTALRDGLNKMTIVYTSDPEQPLRLWIEERHWNDEDRKSVAEFYAPANDSKGRKVTRELRFEFHGANNHPPTLGVEDKHQIIVAVDDYYRALAAHDSTRLAAIFEPGVNETKKAFPEAAELFSRMLKGQAQAVAAPGFRMASRTNSPLSFDVEGSTVIVSSTDHKPIFSTLDSSNLQIAPEELMLRKIAGKWTFVPPEVF